MKPERDEIIEEMETIEAMAVAIGRATGHPVDLIQATTAALRAAAERGWVLAKIPERKDGNSTDVGIYGESVWNACLDAIEILEIKNEV